MRISKTVVMMSAMMLVTGSLAIIPLQAAAHCDKQHNKHKKDQAAQSQQPGQAASDTDAETLATVIAIDTNEINAARQAQKEDVSQPVQEYARMLQQEHSKNMQETMNLGQRIGTQPVESSEVQAIKKEGARELAEMSSLNGKEFEQAFVKAMIEDHQEALRLLDARIQETDDPALKQHLMRTREHVQHHLDQAQEL
jgi:putative membrane protein